MVRFKYNVSVYNICTYIELCRFSLQHMLYLLSINSSQVVDEAVLYTHDKRELKRNHPLMLMVTHRRSNLLGHPVSVALVKHKWITSGRSVGFTSIF